MNSEFFQSHWLLLLVKYVIILAILNIPTLLYFFVVGWIQVKVYIRYRKLKKQSQQDEGKLKLLKKLKFWETINDRFEHKYRYDSNNRLAVFLKGLYCIIAFTLTGLSAIFFFVMLCSAPYNRYMYNKLDSRNEYLLSIPTEDLQSTVIRKAEEWNDTLKNSLFLTSTEREYVKEHRIDTQKLWVRFFESVGNVQGREAVVKDE